MWRVLRWLLLLMGSAGACLAATVGGSPPGDLPRAVLTDQPIEIDGALDTDEWRDALVLPLDVEFLPGDNIPAPVRTDGYITYSETHLYVAWRCFDPRPNEIRAHLMNRDEVSTLSQDDHVVLLLDTFDDARRSVQLRVNPFGVQADALFADGNFVEDWSYDLIWESAATVDAEGYTVEISVPFSQLRFPRGSGEQTWGVSMHRSYPRAVRHRTATQPRDRNRSCVLCQLTRVAGFQGMKAGRNLEIAPTLTTLRTEQLGAFGQEASSREDNDLGLSLRWSPTPNWALSAALNPDFSQVEADVAQLDVNQRFALFFQEQRPFFLESSDLFGTPIWAVNTRTVADPDWGVKLTGKQGPHALGVYAARDAANAFLLPSNQLSRTAFLDEEVTSGVLRYRRDVGQSSSLGVLWTGREGEVYSNHVYGADAFLLLDQKHSVRAQVLRSETRYPTSVSTDFSQPFGAFDGQAIQLAHNYDGRDWQTWFWYEDRDESFRADNGFEPRVDYRSVNTGVQRTWWGEEGDFFNRVQSFVRVRRQETQRGDLSEEEAVAALQAQGPLQSFGAVQVRERKELFQGSLHEGLRSWELFGHLQPNGDLFFRFFTALSDEVDLVNNRVGEQWALSLGATWKAGTRLNFQLSQTTRRLDLERERTAGPGGGPPSDLLGGRIFDANLTQLRTVYSLGVRSFVRLILQYQDLERDVALYPFAVEPEEDTLLTQLLYSYTLNPQTVLFAGYSENRLGIQGVTLEATDRTLFLKLGYAWLP